MNGFTSSIKGLKVVLLACGSFNPPTNMHLRMFECAKNFLELEHGCKVVRGIISPVADNFGKAELISAKHRMKMAELATLDSDWIKADCWEAKQTSWTRTLMVLKHHRQELEEEFETSDIRLMLLCGGDVVDSFTRILPSGEHLWKPEDVEEIISDFGIVIVNRTLSDPKKTLDKLNLSADLENCTFIVKDEAFPNEVSSTLLRRAIRKGESIMYCTPTPVVRYIMDMNLYVD